MDRTLLVGKPIEARNIGGPGFFTETASHPPLSRALCFSCSAHSAHVVPGRRVDDAGVFWKVSVQHVRVLITQGLLPAEQERWGPAYVN